MISDARVEKAVEFLRDSSDEHAQASGAIKMYEYKIKRAKALAFMAADGSIALREAIAETSKEVAQAVDEYREMIVKERLIRDQREAAGLLIEVWRTMQANNRAPNV